MALASSSPAPAAHAVSVEAPTLRTRTGDAAFEQRWAAWQARGAAHERRVRHRLAIAAPLVAIVASALYLFLAR